jgi:hypothetical protein
MSPKFSFGVKQARGYTHSPPSSPEVVVACPTDKKYCIDTKYSDAGTCMWPSPVIIKECLDDACAAHPANESIFKTHGEDSYCKDWQKVPEGRVCHWTTDVFCSCDKFDITYTDAKYVSPAEVMPSGYASAQPCNYPINYKAINKRGNVEKPDMGPQGKPLQKLPQSSPVSLPTKSASSTTAIIAVVSCIIFML